MESRLLKVEAANKLEDSEMHSQKRGLLRPHSAGGSWLGGPLPIFVILGLLIVGMYFFYSYNAQSGEIEALRHKLEIITRNHRKLQGEESILKAKMEQLNSDLSNAKGTFGAKEKECDAELSKLRADVLEEKDNRKKVDEDAKDSQRTISKLRDQLTECRANTTELNDKVTKQEEIIQQLNQTILSSAKQTKTGSAVDEQAEGAKSMNQNGVNEPANNANIPSEKNADDKLREQTNGKEGVEPAANVASAGQTDKNANASKVEQQADKNDDRQVDSNARRPASGEGVQSTNRTATDAKAGGEVGDDSMPAPKQPGHVEVGFNKPDSESKGAGGADGVDNVNDGRNAADEGKSAGLANANADTADGERKVGDEQKADERQKVDDEQKKVDDEQKKVEDEQKVDDQEKPDGLERSENGKENAEPGVGRAPPREKDSLVGEDEKDNQVKPPKVDPKSADYRNDDMRNVGTTRQSMALDSPREKEADKAFDAGREDQGEDQRQDQGDDQGRDQGAVEFEDNEDRINKQPVGRYNRLESPV